MKSSHTLKRMPVALAALVHSIFVGGASHAQPANTNAASLPTITVRAEQEAAAGYARTNATSGLKMDVPLLETPQAISVVPRTVLDDQNVRKLEEALRNVAGVTTGGYYSDWDYYRIRGFDAALTTYWDGLRGDYSMNAEMFGLERVEVVKGPASALYGQGPLGGLVNLVSKRPRPEFFTDLEFTIGSFNFYEPTLDFNTPLNEEKTVYFRLPALYRTQDSFVDFADKQRAFFAPALTWEISDRTTLTILTHYLHDWGQLAFPLPARGTVLPNINGQIPIERYIGELDSNNVEQWRAKLGYELKHEFNDIFALRQNLSLNRMKQDWDTILYPSSLDPDQRTLYRYPYDYEEQFDRIAVDTALEAKFETGPLQHHMVLGVDYYRTRSDSTSRQIDYTDFPGSYLPIDLFNPVYGLPLPAFATENRSITDTDSWGLYVQDHVKMFEKLTLTVGSRFDWSSSDDDSVDGISPRAGLTYEFVPGVAAYANYSQSFNPQWFSRDSAGNVIDPETGENFEVGLKTSLLDGRITTLFSLFHLTRQNIATANLATPDPFDAIASAEQRSRGVELEGAFVITEGLDLTLAYAFIDTEQRGVRLQGVPDHTFNAWLKYTIQDGPIRGLGFGVGGTYYTDQQGDATFELPAYGLLNAGVFYNRGQFSAQVNVNNILDERYFPGAYNDVYVLPGEPLNVRATVGWSF